MVRGLFAAALAVGVICYTAAARTTVTLGTWATDLSTGTGLRLQQLADGFNQSQDEIYVEVKPIPGYNEVIPVHLAAGAGPDIILVRNDEVLSLNDFLLDLRPYFERSGLDPAEYIPGLVKPGSAKMVRIPGNFGLLNFANFYRPSMFAAAGLASPVDMHRHGAWTWDGVLDVAR